MVIFFYPLAFLGTKLKRVNPVRLITFDLDNTLWDVVEVIGRAEAKLGQYLDERFANFATQVGRRRRDEERDALLAEKPAYRGKLSLLREESLYRTLRAAGLEEKPARKEARLAFECFLAERNSPLLFEGVLPALKKLSAQVQLGALTNGNADVEKMGLGEIFSFQYSAESVGKRKPDAAVFNAALEHAGVTAAQALHIGDHPTEDVMAALNLGWRAVWANPLCLQRPTELATEVESYTDLGDWVRNYLQA